MLTEYLQRIVGCIVALTSPLLWSRLLSRCTIAGAQFFSKNVDVSRLFTLLVVSIVKSVLSAPTFVTKISIGANGPFYVLIK